MTLVIDVNGTEYFSKLNLAQAYHQLPLEEDSRYITSFSTHVGLFTYKRLAYAVAGAEIFKHVLHQNLQGIPRIKVISPTIHLSMRKLEKNMKPLFRSNFNVFVLKD